MTRPADFKTSILRMVAEAFPSIFYGHVRTYVVFAVRADGTLDLAPPADAGHLAPLQAVPPWLLGSVRVKPAVGTEVGVAFRDANRSRPFLVACAPSPLATDLTIAAGPTGAYPTEHAASVEGTLNLLQQIVLAVAAANPGIITGAGLSAAWVAAVNAALGTISAGSIAAFSAALDAAIAAKAPDPTGTAPGVAWPNVRGA